MNGTYRWTPGGNQGDKKANIKKHGKKLMKSKRPEEYTDAAAAIFRDLTLLDDCSGGW